MTLIEGLKRIGTIFRLPNARLLLLVRIFGQSGDGLLQTALATFILFSPERQNSPEKIAVAFAILLIPYSVIGPFVGVFIDRWSRQEILRWANVLRTITMMLTCFVVFHHSQGLLLAVLVLISLGTNRFLQACLASSVPHVVTRESLVTANALFPTLGTTSAAIAAGAGIGIQKLFSSADHVNAFLIMAGAGSTFIASVLATRIFPATTLGPHGVSPAVRHQLLDSVRDLIAGTKLLRTSTSARNSMLAASTQRFAFGLTTIFALVLSRTQWSQAGKVSASISDFGACAGSAAAGAFVAALISTLVLSEPDHDGQRILRQSHLRRLAIISAIITSLITLWGMQVGSLISICISAFAIAFVGQLLKINADTTIQATVEDGHRGRIFSIFDMQLNASLVIGISIYALSPFLAHHKLVISLVTSCSLLLCTLLIQKIPQQNSDV